MILTESIDTSEQPDLLIVDDDEIFSDVLAKAMTKRGFSVRTTHNIETALSLAETIAPEYAIVDLKLSNESGLLLVEKLKALDPGTRIVMLTGYASIATAVEAIKLGATHYLAKPVDADEIMAAFERTSGETDTPISANPLSVGRLEWEYIHRILAENDYNISVTARALNMHRRTLQRKLAKKPLRE
ncbi:response regulator transcription factor [Nitrosomonas sp.]|uniref:response regulator transcription factor n=1 Tax=Nitrosomonas sp. TaxID=42353 RepID=UPI001D90E449|nr:response regulator transcription factor [Nitrosomonas sp.]MCB1949081.1 response regulator transcription factor [Nitrosomonas sp.]MCP5244020.1 response regulator transcription factor [Burkholderiales bacterium]MDR4514310.1 response regulator transcription factor [Nitrosomonas sp.]